jgi:outer membrane protein assembly factor BamB
MSRPSILSILFLLCFCAAGQSEVKEQWRAQGWGITDSSPVVFDVDHDGDDDIIFGTETGFRTNKGLVVAMDENKKVLWKKKAGASVSCSPALADLDGDGKSECLVLNNKGLLLCLDASTGETKWDFKLPGEIDWAHTTPAVGDVNNDGTPDVVVADKKGNVVCLNCKGQTIWTENGGHGNVWSPAIGDLDGDGMLEILIAGTKRPLTCYKHDGTVRWAIDGDKGGSSPHIADLNGDGKPEILFSIENEFQVLDGTGKVLWTRDLGAKVDSGVTVVDLDLNGKPDILIPDLKNVLHLLDAQGNETWTANIGERCRRNPAVADVDGNGALEVILGGYDGTVYIFTHDGQLQESIPISAKMNATPTLLDFDNDDSLDMVCCVSNLHSVNDASVRYFEWTKSGPDAKILCAEYRNGGKRTGFFGRKMNDTRPFISSCDIGNLFVGNHVFSCVIENPKKADLSVQLSITFGSNAPLIMVEKSNTPRIAMSFPYKISGKTTTQCVFEVSVKSEDKVICCRKSEVEIIPFVRELTQLDRDFAVLQSLLPTLDDAERLKDRAFRLEANYQKIRPKALVGRLLQSKDRMLLRDDLGKLLADLSLLEKMAVMAKQCDDKSSCRLLTVLANPWAPYGGMKELLEGRSESFDGIEALEGELEAAAVNLFNFSDTARTFRVTLPPDETTQGNFPPAPTEAVQLREVLAVPTQMYDKSADALPKLNQAQTITVPAWGSRQLWVDVNTKFFKPGEQEVVLNFKSLDIEPLSQSISIPMTVWPVTMPKKHSFKLCHWGYVNRSILKDQPVKAAKDQIDLKTSIYVCTAAPIINFDEKGDIISIDNTALDAYLDLYLTPENQPFFLLFHTSGLRGPAKQGSDAYNKAHVAGLRKLVKHLESRGLSYDDWAFYPVDEPGLRAGLVEKQIYYGKLAREADPKIQIYTDPVGKIALEELDAINPYIDIWCPNLTTLLLDFVHEEKLERIKSYGEPMWTYSCDGNSKHLSPIAYYRATAWLAWHHGITATGFWNYCSATNDPWYRPAVREDYLFTYQGDGVVHSKRWNAIRDAIEDYSIFVMLRDAADKAEAAKTKPAAVAKARTLLNDGIYSVAVYPGLNGENTVPELEGPGATRIREDVRWKNLRKVRREMVELIQTLTVAVKK